MHFSPSGSEVEAQPLPSPGKQRGLAISHVGHGYRSSRRSISLTSRDFGPASDVQIKTIEMINREHRHDARSASLPKDAAADLQHPIPATSAGWHPLRVLVVGVLTARAAVIDAIFIGRRTARCLRDTSLIFARVSNIDHKTRSALRHVALCPFTSNTSLKITPGTVSRNWSKCAAAYSGSRARFQLVQSAIITGKWPWRFVWCFGTRPGSLFTQTRIDHANIFLRYERRGSNAGPDRHRIQRQCRSD
jgi:hypothetical protein